jgi:hypothetical protein
MTAPSRVRCLDDELGEYVSGRLAIEREWAWDRHLVACRLCSQAVADERRLRAALAGAPSMPGDLRASLIDLGRTLLVEPAPAAERRCSSTRPALLPPGAPPCHRSPLRATMIAAAAAGVSAAAAWSLTVAGAPTVRPAPVTPATPLARVSVPALTTGAVVAPVGWSQLGRLAPTTDEQAESAP